MADPMQAAVFRAIADFSSLISQSRQAQTALGGVEQQAERSFGQRFGKNVADRGKQMQEFGGRATRNVTLPIAALGGVAVHTFAKFETAITQAGTKAGATKAELADMKDVALEMGARTKFSGTEAAVALDNLAAAGFNARDSIKVLPAVTLAAQAANEDLGLTAAVTSQAMNAFNIDTDKAAHVADVFAVSANTTALDMQGLADALATAGEVGPRFNQSLEDVVATTGRLVDMGVPAASAGTAIRQALTSLSAPTQKANTLLEDLGIKTTDATGAMLPLPDLIRNVEKGLADNNPKMAEYARTVGMSDDALKAWAKQQGVTITQAREIQTAMEKGGESFDAYTLKQLFGVEGAKAFALAMSEGKPVILDAQKDAEKMAQLQDGLAKKLGVDGAKAWIANRTEAGKFTASGADAVEALSALAVASDGASEKAAKAFDNTTAQKIDNLQGSIETLAITMVGQAKPAIDAVVTGLAGAIGWLTDASEKFPVASTVVLGLVAALAALGPTVWVLGTIARGIGSVVSTASGGVKAVKSFGGWVKGVGAGTNKTGSALASMRLRMMFLRDSIVAGSKALGQWVAATARSIAAGVRQAAVWAAQKVQMVALRVWMIATAAATRAWAIAQIALNAAMSMNPIGLIIIGLIALAALFVTMYQRVGWFRTAVDALWAGLKVAFTAIGALAMWLWNNAIKPAFGGMRSGVNALGAAARWLWANAIKPAFEAIGKIIGIWWKVWVKPQLDAFRWLIRNVIGPVVNWLWKNVISPAFGAIGRVISAAWKNVIKPAFDAMKSGVRGVRDAFEAAKDRIGTIWARIKSLVKEPIKWAVEQVVNRFIGGVNAIIPGKGPLSKISTKGWKDGGYTGALAASSVAGYVHGDEFVVRSPSRRRIERQHPGLLDRMNRFGEVPGLYKDGGRVYPVKGSKAWTTYAGHTGVDFPRATGTPVYAAHTGTITATPRLGYSYGHHIRQSGDGGTSIYAHLSRIMARVGQLVEAGTQIGKVGSTGNSTGPHLHFERRPPGTDSGTGAWLRGAGTPNALVKGLEWLTSKFNFVDKMKGWTANMDAHTGIYGGGLKTLVTDAAAKAWDWMKDKATDVLGTAKEIAGKVGSKIRSGIGALNPFDTGGLATGVGYLQKMTPQPERVLSPEQTKAFERAMTQDFMNPRLEALLAGFDDNKAFRNAQAPTGMFGGPGAQRVYNDNRQYTWNVYNPTVEKTSATTLKTLTKTAHGGLDG